MRKVLTILSAVVFLGVASVASATEWTGKISDSMCATKHATEHGGKKMTEHECVEACVKGGASYVFVSGDKVYKIANQDFAALKTHSGYDVVLTGDLKDETITVTNVERAKPKK